MFNGKKVLVRFLNKEEITVNKTDTILDAGCGPAGIFMVLEGNEVVAIDPLLETYQSKLPAFNEHYNSNINFESIYLEQFRRNNYFDKVFCLNAINHVSDLNQSIFNICNAVKKGGIIYLSIDAHNYGFLKWMFKMIPGDILHPHQLNLEEYRTLLHTNGMTILKESLIKSGFIFNYYLITAIKD